MFLCDRGIGIYFPRLVTGLLLKAHVALKASAAAKVRGILRDMFPRQSGRAAAPQSAPAGRGTPAEHGHLEERACDPARTVGLCARVDVKGESVSAGCEGGKEFGFFEGGLSLPLPVSADL